MKINSASWRETLFSIKKKKGKLTFGEKENHPKANVSCTGFLLRHLFYLAVTVRVFLISNGNRTGWNPIRSVIIRVITKSDDRAAGVRFVYHEYDFRPNWTTRGLITN